MDAYTDETDRICEPMDVDLSMSSVKSMDVSFQCLSDCPTQTTSITEKEISNVSCINRALSSEKNQLLVIKRYHINIKKNKKNLITFLLKYVTLIFMLLILLFSVTLYHINFTCSEDLNLEYLYKKLSEELYGQDAAIHDIIKILSVRSSSKILFLYGGTGVGKTFTVSMMLENITTSLNIYHYHMPSFVNSFPTQFMFGLTMCSSSMLIVDDIKRNDMHINKYISDIVEKSENLKKNITILLIYNCESVDNSFGKHCDASFYEQLKGNFYNIRALKKFINFKPLKEEHLRKCIEKELGRKKLNKVEFDNIMKNFNVSLDGCKGVYTKIKYLFSNS